jgi:hypothetical protein
MGAQCRKGLAVGQILKTAAETGEGFSGGTAE